MYLSGPIEFDNMDFNWRVEPTEVMAQKFGVNVSDPFADPKQAEWGNLSKARDEKDFEEIRRIGRSFVRKDLGTIDRQDFLVAYLPYGVPTCGTHHEIINSHDRQKPTLIVSGKKGKEYIPPWYYGFIHYRYFFNSWAELYDYLAEVNDGKHTDDWLWSMVYEII